MAPMLEGRDHGPHAGRQGPWRRDHGPPCWMVDHGPPCWMVWTTAPNAGRQEPQFSMLEGRDHDPHPPYWMEWTMVSHTGWHGPQPPAGRRAPRPPMMDGVDHSPHAGRRGPQFSSMLESVVVEGEVTGHVVSEARKQRKMMLLLS